MLKMNMKIQRKQLPHFRISMKKSLRTKKESMKLKSRILNSSMKMILKNYKTN